MSKAGLHQTFRFLDLVFRASGRRKAQNAVADTILQNDPSPTYMKGLRGKIYFRESRRCSPFSEAIRSSVVLADISFRLPLHPHLHPLVSLCQTGSNDTSSLCPSLPPKSRPIRTRLSLYSPSLSFAIDRNRLLPRPVLRLLLWLYLPVTPIHPGESGFSFHLRHRGAGSRFARAAKESYADYDCSSYSRSTISLNFSAPCRDVGLTGQSEEGGTIGLYGLVLYGHMKHVATISRKIVADENTLLLDAERILQE